MKILVSSGEYKEIIELGIDNRRIAHRIGCLRAVESRESLSRIIRTSIHLDSQDPQDAQDDDLYSSTEVVEGLLEMEGGGKWP